MQEKSKSHPNKKSSRLNNSAAVPNASGNQQRSSSRWSAVHRTRLSYKVGLPLGSGSGGDTIER